MRIALVHDFLMQDGGAERVLQSLMRLFPDAPVFTLLHNRKLHRLSDVQTSFLQQFPWPKSLYTWLLAFMPAAIEHLPLRDYDVILSSCSSFAKGVIPHEGARHICYCHTPPRFLWLESRAYLQQQKQNYLARAIAPFTLSRLRQWDQCAAGRVDEFIANSATVQQRIARTYRRPSTVIHPPVSVERFSLSSAPKTYWLAGGRMVGYKRLDLAIAAANRIKAPLKVFGEGPLRAHLENQAGPTVEFLGRVSQEEQANLFADCIAYLHPQEEDFGITAVETMASGRPIIAYGKGGAMETIAPNESGILIEEQSWEALVDAMIRLPKMPWNNQAIRAKAEQYSEAVFHEKIRRLVGV